MMRIGGSSKKKKDDEPNSSNNNRAVAAFSTSPPLSPVDQRVRTIQKQVRSLRRRLWHAFATEDAATALRAYTATAEDLEEWILEEIQEAREEEALRIEQERVSTKYNHLLLMIARLLSGQHNFQREFFCANDIFSFHRQRRAHIDLSFSKSWDM